MLTLVFLNLLRDYSCALVGHRAIIFSSQTGPSTWKALKESNNQPEPNNNNDDDDKKIRTYRILFCFIALVYLVGPICPKYQISISSLSTWLGLRRLSNQGFTSFDLFSYLTQL